MLNKRIIFNDPIDGHCVVIIPVDQTVTIEEIIDRNKQVGIIPANIDLSIIEASDLPDRELRDAWEHKDKSLKINLDKAKNITLNNLRAKRNKKLDDSDKELVRALENNDTKKIDTLKVERQRLRDLTNPLKALDVASKPNDLSVLKQIKDLGSIQ
jgi:hypothetical protein